MGRENHSIRPEQPFVDLGLTLKNVECGPPQPAFFQEVQKIILGDESPAGGVDADTALLAISVPERVTPIKIVCRVSNRRLDAEGVVLGLEYDEAASPSWSEAYEYLLEFVMNLQRAELARYRAAILCPRSDPEVA